MATNPRGRKARRRNDYQRERSPKGVEARRHKRIERSAAWRDVGGFITDGVLGVHKVRLLACDTYGERFAVTVDSQHRQARTLRGFVACIAKMIYQKSGWENE